MSQERAIGPAPGASPFSIAPAGAAPAGAGLPGGPLGVEAAPFVPEHASAAAAAPLLSHWADDAGAGHGHLGAAAGAAASGAHDGGDHGAWDFDSAWQGAHPGGPALPGVMGEMEHRFGHDFSGVTFSHEMPDAARQNGARAAASEEHVALDPSIDVESHEGKHVLAHELAHVVQQRHGEKTRDALDDHVEAAAQHPAVMEEAASEKHNRDRLEQEADAAGEQAAAGGQAQVRGGSQVPKNQFFGLGDLWDKAKGAASGAWNTVKGAASDVVDTAKAGASWVGDKVSQGASWVGDKAKAGASWLGDKAKKGASWMGDKVKKGASWLGDKAKKGASWLGDKAKKGASWVGGKLKQGWELAKKGASWLGGKIKEGYGAVKKKVGQVYGDIKRGVSQEGLLGVLTDPVGAMDRQRAQRELSDRFQVVGPDYKGPRNPNTVTQAEYEQICRTYSDVRLGRGDLTIDPSGLKTEQEREAYRQGALRDIAAMMQTGSGRREISQLHDNHPRDEQGNPRRSFFGLGPEIHRHTTMVPLFRQDASGNFDPNLGLDRTNGYAAPDGAGSDRQVNADGTLGRAGSGTDVHIRYNPGVNIGDAYPGLTGTNPWLGQMRSDVLLAHEMNHAVKQTSGMVDPRAVGAADNAANPTDPDMAHDASYRDQYGNPLRQVEHQAVGIGTYANDDMTENAYRRERRQMADQGATGQIAGDSTLGQRNTYVPRNPPPAPPPGPGPAPAPAPAPGPGVPEFMRDMD